MSGKRKQGKESEPPMKKKKVGKAKNDDDNAELELELARKRKLLFEVSFKINFYTSEFEI